MKKTGERVIGKIVFQSFTFQSKSNPDGKPYESLVYTDGSASCNCRGWVFNKKCWHIDEAKTLAGRLVSGEVSAVSLRRSVAAVQFPNLARSAEGTRVRVNQPAAIAPVQTLVLERGKRLFTLTED